MMHTYAIEDVAMPRRPTAYSTDKIECQEWECVGWMDDPRRRLQSIPGTTDSPDYLSSVQVQSVGYE
jgi:hypothetical protein